jgi:hypothetical protein
MKDIQELREFIGDTMKELKSGSLSIDKAKTISKLAQVMVNASKVESDFLRTMKSKHGSEFLLPHKNGSPKQLENNKVNGKNS